MTTTHKTAHARRHRIKIAAATMLVAAATVGAGELAAAATANATCGKPSCASPVAPTQPKSPARDTHQSLNSLNVNKSSDRSSNTLFGPGRN